MIEKSANIELDKLCNAVRKLCKLSDYAKCFDMICEAMSTYPNDPVPHNLLGVVLEKTGDHINAMRHFRCAIALDPTYKPSNQNLQTYGTFFSDGKCAFDYSDIAPDKYSDDKLMYDKYGICHVVSGKRVDYDENGVGHIVMEDKR